MKSIILMGAPGSGKGSQSQLLKSLGYIQISTGDLLREEISSGSKLGQEINNLISKGNFISDELALSLIQGKYNDKEFFIFDGFPRTLNQAKMLDEQVLKNSDVKVLFLQIDDTKLLDRVIYRRTCPNCSSIFNLKFNPPKKEDTCSNCNYIGLSHRKDDEAEILKKRLEVYHASTKPVIEYYESLGRLVTVNADKDQQEIFNELLEFIS